MVIKMKIVRCFLLLLSIFGMIAVLLYDKGIPAGGGTYASFEGKGTAEDPCLIPDKEALETLRDLVNEGEAFEGIYFRQSDDIDLEEEEWIPIGVFGSGNYFGGIYDGGAHRIMNLRVSAGINGFPSNGGLFGVLDGTVRNLGIESGLIEGDYVGAITSHGTSRAMILNCYNKATVRGTGRAGGIVDNLGEGAVINCVNFGQVEAPVSACAVSYDAGWIISVYPHERACTDYFTGSFFAGVMEGNSPQELLNAGIEMLVEEGIIRKEDVAVW